MKRILSILLAAVIMASVFPAMPSYAASEVPKLEAESAMVIDMTTGDVLYKLNENEMRYPASTTKMVTGILAIEKLDFKSTLTADQEVAATLGTSLKLKDGEEINAWDALNAMMVGSCNDCAVLIAKAIAGSVYEFVNTMNAKLAEIGVTATHFTNPHGLHEDDHYSCASDLAKIAMYCMENKTFRQIVRQGDYTVPATNKTEQRVVDSTNLLIKDENDTNRIYVDNVLRYCKYPGVFGIKTGYTKAAGGCLISAAEKDGTKIMCIILKSSSMGRFADSIKLLDWGFNNFRTIQCTHAGDVLEDTVAVKRGAFNKVGVKIRDDIFYTIPSEASDSIITTRLVLEESVKAPVEEGQVLGTLEVYESGLKVGATDVLATDTVEKGGILSIFGIEDATARKIWLGITLFIFLLIAALAAYVIVKRRQIARKKAARAAKLKARQEAEERRRQLWSRSYDQEKYGRTFDDDQK
ncbi:MAG: D-alanyl-D-alanine carboxypeptidase [Firmicutes bacterium]|nr:D-alanyl-D-alanine carboxypeptidase [Bacillota bacterium]